MTTRFFRSAGWSLAMAMAGTVLASATAAAQRRAQSVGRSAAPTGQEIAAAARGARLDAANGVTATFQGKAMKFTPVQARQPAANEPARVVEDGLFIGVMENAAPGDETTLPAGRYNMYVAKVGGVWKAYAESGGRVVAEAVRVNVTPGEGAGRKPEFREKGWCFFAPVPFPWFPFFIIVVFCF